MATAVVSAEAGTLGLYVGVEEGEFADLEVVAAAAIAWAQTIKAAATELYPEEEIRVSLIAAEPGSSRWLAKIEQSSANKAAERVKARWRKVPAIVQLTLGLVVAVPLTIKPTYEFYEEQIQDAAEALGLSSSEAAEAKKKADAARAMPSVEGAQRQVFKALQRDPKITGVASGVPIGKNWKPELIPSNQFAQADGLFSPQEDIEERKLPVTLDVVVLAPQLENKPRSWKFKQEGLPPFTATMRDEEFLAALDRSAIREQFRTNIPMTVKLEILQRRNKEGEWVDAPRGRSVVKVLSPKVG